MQAASRESYAAAAEKLRALADSATPEALAGTADEILAVAGLLSSEPRLRRALADPARIGEDRVSLSTSVFDGKIGKPALGLLTTLVGGRWSSSGDLLDGTEKLGVDTLLAGAEKAGELGE